MRGHQRHLPISDFRIADFDLYQISQATIERFLWSAATWRRFVTASRENSSCIPRKSHNVARFHLSKRNHRLSQIDLRLMRVNTRHLY
jgi:hypothetical protein